MATEGDRDPLVDGVSQANVSREELRDMLRAAVREPPPPAHTGTCCHSLASQNLGALHTVIIIGIVDTLM